MIEPQPWRLRSVEEYLRFEDASPIRHEFVAGEAYAMSGTTLRHNLIVQNIARSLYAAAQRRRCLILAEQVKLRIEDDFYYPDVIVACTRQDLAAVSPCDPCALFEVLSDSTRRTDRREKRVAYGVVESLGTYVVVEQDARRVDRHWRDEQGMWQTEEIGGSGHRTEIPVPCLDTTLTLDEIYEDVELPAPRLRRMREVALG